MISGNSERISPGVIRSEVGRPEGLWLTPGRPTSERITPGEILSELPEIATPVRFWPKFLENHMVVNLQKISLQPGAGRFGPAQFACTELYDSAIN